MVILFLTWFVAAPAKALTLTMGLLMRCKLPQRLGVVLSVAIPLVAQGQSIDRRNEIVRAVARSKDAVVNLRTMRTVPARLEDNEGGGRVRGLGTGVVIDPRGYVVTNYHVVEKVERIQMVTAAGREYSARLLNYDEKADLAVLKVDAAERFGYLALCGAGDPILGETVIAIGNPWGLENSISVGIVSAINRKLPLPNDEVFDDLIQTDAAINPGNSGGALLNVNGDLLGVNVAIRSNSWKIGFAIPTRKVRRIVEELMGLPPISIARQGLELRELEENPSGASVLTTVRVDRVEPGSQAFTKGFRPGDELVKVAGQEVRVRFDLYRALWDRKFGDELDFIVRRKGGETHTFTLKMTPSDELTDAELLWQKLGIRAQSVPAERVRSIDSSWNGGLLVLQVANDSPASRAGFRPGDILIGLHEYETINLNNVRFVMQWKDLTQFQPISVHMVRDGAKMPVKRMTFPAHP